MRQHVVCGPEGVAQAMLLRAGGAGVRRGADGGPAARSPPATWPAACPLCQALGLAGWANGAT